MFYDAICIENKDYLTTGTIRARVFAFFHYPKRDNVGALTGIDDLTILPESTEWTEEGGKHRDFDAMIFTPLGGGRNYGMFWLPQVNSKGVVTFLNGDYNRPLWVGNFFEPIHSSSDYNTVDLVPSPSDDLNYDGEDMDGYAKGRKFVGTIENEDGETDSIVIRTKSPTVKSTTADDMDFQTKDTENIILINKKKVVIQHCTEWVDGEIKKRQVVTIDSTGENSPLDVEGEFISLRVEEVDTPAITTIAMNKEKILLKIDDGSAPIDMQVSIKDGVVFSADVKEVVFMDKADNLVRYSFLKELIEKYETHVHIAQGPAGPTTGAMEGPAGAPNIISVTASAKNDMKSPKLFTE